MPADSTGLVKPPAGSGLSLGGNDGPAQPNDGGGGGGLAGLSKQKKTGLAIGSVVTVLLGVWLYARHKGSSSSGSTAATTTAPEVIAPTSTPASEGATNSGSGFGVGQGGNNGAFGTALSSLTAELAQLQTELQLAATAAAPVPNQQAAVTQMVTPTPTPTTADITQGENITQAVNNQNAQTAYINAVGQNAAGLYEQYAASLPAGGVSNDAPLPAASQTLLNEYNAAVSAYQNGTPAATPVTTAAVTSGTLAPNANGNLTPNGQTRRPR